MEWIYIIVNAIMFILLVLFIKHLFPSYMREKGKNLATKEDIQEITRKTEEVQKEFKEDFELFTSDVKFKYDFYYEQYAKLYSKLYAIIAQSEYVRQFIKAKNKQDISFDEVPFLEISKTRKMFQKIDLREGKPITATKKQKEITTSISQFNKKEMCDYIIENGEYASQKLLKLAVSYRFASSHYSGNPEVNNSSCEDIANEEEFKLIKEMVCCIVSEYNYLRKELKMEYDETELKMGIPKLFNYHTDL